jgi:hypothetical protein
MILKTNNMRTIIAVTEYSSERRGLLTVVDNEEILFSCKTLELPWINNLPNFSCIPKGKYIIEKVTMTNYPVIAKAHPNSFYVKDVPNRSGILIHPFNFVAGNHIESKGCISPGMSFGDINGDGFTDIYDPVTPMKKLNQLLPDISELYIV